MSTITEAEVFGNDLYYSGSVENIRRVIKMLKIGAGKTASFSEKVCRIYQKEINNIIDNELSPFYATPLVKDCISDRYPHPIPYIASRLVASSIVLVEFTEIDANESEAAKSMEDAAYKQLLELTDGFFAPTRRLKGQRLKAKHHFACPGIAPLKPKSGGGAQAGFPR